MARWIVRAGEPRQMGLWIWLWVAILIVAAWLLSP